MLFKRLAKYNTILADIRHTGSIQAGLGKDSIKNNEVEKHIYEGTELSSQALLVIDVPKKNASLSNKSKT